MAINKITIEEGCTLCTLCETICGEVFEMGPDKARVKANADLEANEATIKEAVDSCPVAVIKIS